MYTLEICVDNERDGTAALQLGADRIEICSELSCGGITPPSAMISSLCSTSDANVVVLVRPRAGDFVYTRDEFDRMADSVDVAHDCGATGIAIGALTSAGELDLEMLSSLASRTNGLELVMHRAFDHVKRPIEAIDYLIEMGFSRVLSSGGTPTALKGVSSLRSLVNYSGDAIQFVAAGGVRSSNARTIIEKSAVTQIHSSGRTAPSPSGKQADLKSSSDGIMSSVQVSDLVAIVKSISDSSS